MIKSYLPSKGKIELATDRFNKILQWTVPAKSLITDWIPIIRLEESNRDIFESIYRGYHHSFKVTYMKGNVSNFRDMIVYLFCKRIDKRFLLRKKFNNLLGFPCPIEDIKLEDVFHKDSLTYKYINDVLNCKEKDPEEYWQDWTENHLTLMGGVYWSMVSSISLLGMLGRYIKKEYRQPQLISYTDGVANYILGDINYEELNK